MDFNVTDFFKLILKNPITISLTIVFASGLVLFLPNSMANSLYINSLKAKYGFIIGVVFIISLSIMCVSLMVGIYNFFKKVYMNKQLKK